MTAPPTDAAVRRRRLQLVAIALVFHGPQALAFWLYYGGGAALRPSGHVNRGTLVTPVVALPELRLPVPGGGTTAPDFLRGKWSLVTVAGAHCDADCRRVLEEEKRVRLALERDGSRVRRVLLGPPGCCGPAEVGAPQADLVVAWLEGAEGARLGAPFAALAAADAAQGRVSIVDPLGNLMMTYAPGADLKDLLKDLEKLLRLSHIG